VESRETRSHPKINKYTRLNTNIGLLTAEAVKVRDFRGHHQSTSTVREINLTAHTVITLMQTRRCKHSQKCRCTLVDSWPWPL